MMHGSSVCTGRTLRALASGLSTIQSNEPCSVSLIARYPVSTLLVAGYLMLKIQVSGCRVIMLTYFDLIS